MLKQRGRVEEAALPSPPRPGLAQVFNLRFWSGESSTRVVLDVEKQVQIQQARITDPDRLWIDLDGTRLHPNLVDRSFPVGDGFLEKIRVAQRKDSVVRVVLDFKDVKDHTIFYLQNPTRLVVDVRGTPRAARRRPRGRGHASAAIRSSRPTCRRARSARLRSAPPSPSPRRRRGRAARRLAAPARRRGSRPGRATTGRRSRRPRRRPRCRAVPSPTPAAPWPSPTPPPARNARSRAAPSRTRTRRRRPR